VRSYLHKPLPKKLLEQILEAGRYAPTGSNSQNVHYLVLTTAAEIDRLRRMVIAFYERIFRLIRNRFGALSLKVFAGSRIVEELQESIPKLEHAKELMDQGRDCLFYDAPAVLLVHAEAWDTSSAFNCALALYNCSLMAHTLGIGCCFNGYLQGAINNSRQMKKRLGIPRDHRRLAALRGQPHVGRGSDAGGVVRPGAQFAGSRVYGYRPEAADAERRAVLDRFPVQADDRDRVDDE
jgi:nitroreductase